MRPYSLHQPASVEEAVALAAEHANAKYLAGGTDLVVNMRRRIAEPEHVIALHGIESLRGIRRDGDALVIGSGTTLAEIAEHEDVRKDLPVLAEAAGIVAGPTIRRMATLGGNLMLDTRCRYYNQTYFWRKSNDFCLKKEGSVCHVAPGGSFCWAAFSGDTPPALLILGAEIDIAGAKGTRRQPLLGFYGKDGRWSIGLDEYREPGGLAPGELILGARVRIPTADFEAVYEKLRVRDSIDYPLAGVALGVRWKDKRAHTVAEIKIGLTAVNPRPELVGGMDAFGGRTFDLETVEALAKLAHRTGKPMRTTTADPAYRRSMITALVEKAAMRLVPELQSALMQRARWA
jgi:4-hydroxybenzoyl-CoA reductase subunit beta